MSAPYNRNQSVALLSSLKTGVVHGKRKKNVGDEGWCVFFLGGGVVKGIRGEAGPGDCGQGCLEKGMIKTTYGTGSSIMMNIGDKPVISTHGVAASLAWGMDGRVNYVLEGNINYTGAVITWLKDDLKLIASASETEGLARQANEDDATYLVPAFTGIGAPYWDSEARAAIVGITRKTRTPELVKAGLECIAYQIADVVEAMSRAAVGAVLTKS